MNLKELKARGGFVSAVPVKRDVEWTHPDPDTGEEVTDKFSVFVKRQSFGAIERLFVGNDDQSKSATFISECILLGEDGKDRMTYQDAYQLDPGLAAVLVKAINEVNKTDQAKAKN